jgi:hypothetical protein
MNCLFFRSKTRFLDTFTLMMSSNELLTFGLSLMPSLHYSFRWVQTRYLSSRMGPILVVLIISLFPVGSVLLPFNGCGSFYIISHMCFYEYVGSQIGTISGVIPIGINEYYAKQHDRSLMN